MQSTENKSSTIPDLTLHAVKNQLVSSQTGDLVADVYPYYGREMAKELAERFNTFKERINSDDVIVAISHKTMQVTEDEWVYREYTLACNDLTTIADIRKWTKAQGLEDRFVITVAKKVTELDKPDDLPF